MTDPLRGASKLPVDALMGKLSAQTIATRGVPGYVVDGGMDPVAAYHRYGKF